jgi:phage shock protein C
MTKNDPLARNPSGSHSMQKKFRLDKQNAKLMGVSGGIANYFGWDVNLIRIAFVLAALFGVGAPVLIYLAIGLIAD